MTVPSETPAEIPEDLVRQRLAQGEQLRYFTVRVWLENPHLARQAGPGIIAWLWPKALEGE